MKNLPVLLLFLVLIAQISFSQPIPNPGFENWTTDTVFQDPTGFVTTNLQSYATGRTKTIEKTSDSWSGSAIKLENKGFPDDTLIGLTTNGLANQAGLNGGVAYNDRPDSLTAYIKYNMMANDTGLILFQLTKNDTTDISQLVAYQITGSQSSYTRISLPIPYVDTANPDTLLFVVTSGDFDQPQPGSYVFLDEVQLKGNGAAQMPNGDFENWVPTSFTEPDKWFSTNFLEPLGVPQTAFRSSDQFSGQWALELTTVITSTDTFGFISNGSFSEQGPVGGEPISAKPSRLTGYYKYNPINFAGRFDSALAYVGFTKYNQATDSTELIDEIILKLPPSSSYQQFTIPIDLSGQPMPDTVNVTFASSNLTDESNYVGDGSTLLIDSLSLTVNSRPVALMDSTSTKENKQIVINVQQNDSDADSQPLVTSIVQSPANGKVSVMNGDSLAYTPDSGFTGIDSMYYRVCDNGMPVLCDTALVTIDVTMSVGIADGESQNDILVYPTIANNHLHVQLKGFSTNVHLKLISIDGKIVRRQQLNDMSTHVVLPVSHVAEGIYVLQILTPETALSRKIIVR